uniref:Uncharacterized protein n=1 Tax=Meloidogyne incognita TaxID=6306 RepID=A0A914L5X8_MELIC
MRSRRQMHFCEMKLAMRCFRAHCSRYCSIHCVINLHQLCMQILPSNLNFFHPYC